MISDRVLLEQWVKDHSEELYRWAYYKTSSSETARDLVQDTFLAAAEKMATFKNESSPKTWLFSILNFKIIDVYRKKAKSPIEADFSSVSHFFDENGSWLEDKIPRQWADDESHLLDDPDFRRVLQKCLDALPQKWNAVMKLKYLLSKSGKEICQELDITPTNFWQMMHRAKLNLRECLNSHWFQIN